MRELHLFAGCGGGILAGMLLNHITVAAVEIETFCREVLQARQKDGSLPVFPIFEDVTVFDATPFKGKVDIVCGGFPCQDISGANINAKGIKGARSGLWSEFIRIVNECDPKYVFIENSPMLRTRGLEIILKDLTESGFDAEWGCLSASQTGAKHKRDRMWIMGHSNKKSRCETNTQIDTNRDFREAWYNIGREYWKHIPEPAWSLPESVSHRVSNGMAYRVDRLKAIGNGQVPVTAAEAFKQLLKRSYDITRH